MWAALLFFPGNLFSQKPGALVFFDSILHEIRLETSLPNWPDTLAADYDNNRDDPDRFPEIERLAERFWFDGLPMDSVGFRHRGNFSNVINEGKKKKPFKIDFDSFRDQRFDGLKAVNLINGTNDPSFVREALAYKMMRDMGQAAPRTAFCRFFVNDEFIGLYEIVENVDKAFLKMHFGAAGDDGNLFKTGREAGVSLKWGGPDKEVYKKQGLELKTNEKEDDWSRLIELVRVVNNAPRDSIEQLLPAIFDVDNYLKILAVEKLIYSWDSYWGGGNNFYLYELPDGRTRWIPWDFNETFQEFDGGLVDWVSDPSFLVPTNVYGKRPLIGAIFSVEKWRLQYMDEVCAMLQTGRFGLDSLAGPAVFWHELIKPAYLEDENRLFPFPMFENALTEKTKEVVVEPTTGIGIRLNLEGLFVFIKNRVGWAHEQLGFWDFDCAEKTGRPGGYPLKISPNPVGSFDELTVEWGDLLALPYSKIEVFDAAGRLAIADGWVVVAGFSAKIEVGGLPRGLYFLVKTDGDGRRAVSRFVR